MDVSDYVPGALQQELGESEEETAWHERRGPWAKVLAEGERAGSTGAAPAAPGEDAGRMRGRERPEARAEGRQVTGSGRWRGKSDKARGIPAYEDIDAEGMSVDLSSTLREMLAASTADIQAFAVNEGRGRGVGATGLCDRGKDGSGQSMTFQPGVHKGGDVHGLATVEGRDKDGEDGDGVAFGEDPGEGVSVEGVSCPQDRPNDLGSEAGEQSGERDWPCWDSRGQGMAEEACGGRLEGGGGSDTAMRNVEAEKAVQWSPSVCINASIFADVCVFSALFCVALHVCVCACACVYKLRARKPCSCSFTLKHPCTVTQVSCVRGSVSGNAQHMHETHAMRTQCVHTRTRTHTHTGLARTRISIWQSATGEQERALLPEWCTAGGGTALAIDWGVCVRESSAAERCILALGTMMGRRQRRAVTRWAGGLGGMRKG